MEIRDKRIPITSTPKSNPAVTQHHTLRPLDRGLALRTRGRQLDLGLGTTCISTGAVKYVCNLCRCDNDNPNVYKHVYINKYVYVRVCSTPTIVELKFWGGSAAVEVVSLDVQCPRAEHHLRIFGAKLLFNSVVPSLSLSFFSFPQHHFHSHCNSHSRSHPRRSWQSKLKLHVGIYFKALGCTHRVH